MVAGGMRVNLSVASSDPSTGTVQDSRITIAGGTADAATQFRPSAPGTTTLVIDPPAGFSTSAQFATLAATVVMPGIAVADDIAVGQNLQVEATVSLGEPAPAGGLDVNIESNDPGRLLLSASATEVGHGSLTIRMPAGAATASYFLQGIGDSGTVATKATAAGYRDRIGTITLAPSGVVIGGPPGPPDEPSSSGRMRRMRLMGSWRGWMGALLCRFWSIRFSSTR